MNANIYVINYETCNGTTVVGVYPTEKLAKLSAKEFVEKTNFEREMKVRKSKVNNSTRKVLYSNEHTSDAKIETDFITINEIQFQMQNKKKTKKDSDTPKKGLSAYMIFAKENREKIKQDYFSTNNEIPAFNIIGKLLGEYWNKLSVVDREPYKIKSENDKKRYETDMQKLEVIQEETREIQVEQVQEIQEQEQVQEIQVEQVEQVQEIKKVRKVKKVKEGEEPTSTKSKKSIKEDN